MLKLLYYYYSDKSGHKSNLLLFLWSSYGPEGPGTVCSVQWQQRSATARSYISCLFIFCLLLPLLLMFFCYGRLLLAVQSVARQVNSQLDLWTFVMTNLSVFCVYRLFENTCNVPHQVSRINRSSSDQTEGRVLLMVVTMVTGYLLCWMPYGVVAMIASFGRPGVLTPVGSLIPSLLAKTSTVINPVIYMLLNTQVKDLVVLTLF